MTLEQVVSPVPRSAWSEVVAADPDATFYQTPEWFDAMLSWTGDHDVSRMYVLSDGRRLVLPLARRRPLPRVAFDDASPHRAGFCDLLASGGLRAEDVRLVLQDLAGTDAITTRLKTGPITAGRWQDGLVPPFTASRRRVHVLDLRGGFREVWEQRFHNGTRKAVRRGENSKLEIESDTTARLVPELYDVYLRWIDLRAQQSGLPASLARMLARRREPLRMIETVMASMGGAARLWIARLDGVPVAGSITIMHGRHAAGWRGWSDPTLARPTRANNLLDKLAIETACAAGCEFFYMGESGGIPSLEQFKEGMGATPQYALECSFERLPVSRLRAVGDDAVATAARVAGYRPRASSAGASARADSSTG